MTAGEAEEGVRVGSAEPYNSDLENVAPAEGCSQRADLNAGSLCNQRTLPFTPQLAGAGPSSE